MVRGIHRIPPQLARINLKKISEENENNVQDQDHWNNWNLNWSTGAKPTHYTDVEMNEFAFDETRELESNIGRDGSIPLNPIQQVQYQNNERNFLLNQVQENNSHNVINSVSRHNNPHGSRDDEGGNATQQVPAPMARHVNQPSDSDPLLGAGEEVEEVVRDRSQWERENIAFCTTTCLHIPLFTQVLSGPGLNSSNLSKAKRKVQQFAKGDNKCRKYKKIKRRIHFVNDLKVGKKTALCKTKYQQLMKRIRSKYYSKF